MFPINPTPYIFAYFVIVFLCPWFRFAVCFFSDLRYLRKSNELKLDEFNFIKRRKRIKKFRKENEQARKSYSKVKKWFVITLISWILGFVVLGVVLLILEQNDLLINHSKGIY